MQIDGFYLSHTKSYLSTRRTIHSIFPILAATGHNPALMTFVTAAFLGVLLLMLAGRLRVSAIVVLLLGGIVAGPELLGLVRPEDLGHGLQSIISIAVALILFEGGLTLDLRGYREVWREIWGVLTIGVLVTWLGSTLLIKLLFGFEWRFCLLAGSLIIVTGPTVIGPLLQRIRVRKKLHHILHWEGVLIDPIGVFVALLCFEYAISVGGQSHVLKDFFLRFAVGGVLGLAFGQILTIILRRDWIEEEHVNIFSLSAAMLLFGLSDLIVAESGLLSVTIAGLVIGAQKPPRLHHILTYKEELRDLLIGLLFILLAANLKLKSFLEYGPLLIYAVLAVMLIVRPLNIWLSMRGGGLDWREKTFLSWIAPRGIVAASMASIFALRLGGEGFAQAGFLETFTYAVIAGTVVFQGFSAGLVGKWLRVLEPRPTGWLVIGAHRLGRAVARFIRGQGQQVVLVDTNAREVREAMRENLVALAEDAMVMDPEQHHELYGTGHIIALTPNRDLNQLLCQRWSELIRDANLYRWERKPQEGEAVGQPIWMDLGLEHWMTPGEEVPPLVTRMVNLENANGQGLLLISRGGELELNAPENGEGRVAALKLDARHHEEPHRLPLTLDRVLLNAVNSVPELYTNMLDCIENHVPQVDREKLMQEMMDSESDYASLFGGGIAIPHARIEGIQESILVVARPGNRLVAPDDPEREVNLVFLLLSPANADQEHIEHISNIAQLIGSESSRRELMDAPDAETLHQLIIRA